MMEGCIYMAATFKGGFHIRDHKELTNKIPTKRVPDCDMHIFPMRQHIGAPLKPLVEIGDKVKVGQKIADSAEFVSAPVHSSVSGTVPETRPGLEWFRERRPSAGGGRGIPPPVVFHYNKFPRKIQ